MLSNIVDTVHPIARFRLLYTLLLISFIAVDTRATGSFVLAGEPTPEPDTLQVASGKPAQLDLLTSVGLPAENQCSTILYALGGPIAVKITAQTSRLVFSAEGKNTYRAPIRMEIPPAKPGARFLIKTECLSPTPQVLGFVQIQVPEFDPLEEIRAGLDGHEIQIYGQSARVRALLEEWRIPFKDHATPVPGAIVFAEGPADIDRTVTAIPYILIEFSISSEHTFSLIGQKIGSGWKVQARLPRSAGLSGPGAASQMAQVIRFAHEIAGPPSDHP